MERMGTVVVFSAFQPRKVLDGGAGQAFAGSREVFLDPQQVDRWAGGRGTERLPGDLTSEGMVLQVEESGGALDVGDALVGERTQQPL
ncbi:hypothetical protein ABH905_003870 [Pseudomonas frederiksbergensis]|jgi:hypothetical protein